jgi:hypothetical protein
VNLTTKTVYTNRRNEPTCEVQIKTVTERVDDPQGGIYLYPATRFIIGAKDGEVWVSPDAFGIDIPPVNLTGVSDDRIWELVRRHCRAAWNRFVNEE